MCSVFLKKSACSARSRPNSALILKLLLFRISHSMMTPIVPYGCLRQAGNVRRLVHRYRIVQAVRVSLKRDLWLPSKARCYRQQQSLAGLFLFLGARVTRENNYYILMVRGSVSLKLSMDSAGKTISFSPV